MFAVHLLSFYFTKLKEDQIKKVRTQEAESCLLLHRQDPSLPTPVGTEESLLENTGSTGPVKHSLNRRRKGISHGLDMAYCPEPGSYSELPGRYPMGRRCRERL